MSGIMTLKLRDDGTAEVAMPDGSELKCRHCATDVHGSVAGLLAEMRSRRKSEQLPWESKEARDTAADVVREMSGLTARARSVLVRHIGRTPYIDCSIQKVEVSIVRQRRRPRLRLPPRGPNQSGIEPFPGRSASRSGPFCRRAGDGGGACALRKPGAARQASRMHQEREGPARRRTGEAARPCRPNSLSAECITGAQANDDDAASSVIVRLYYTIRPIELWFQVVRPMENFTSKCSAFPIMKQWKWTPSRSPHFCEWPGKVLDFLQRLRRLRAARSR